MEVRISQINGEGGGMVTFGFVAWEKRKGESILLVKKYVERGYMK